jgi:hypothetical protein
MQSIITKDQLERIARLYKTNKDAGSAIGMHPGAFARLCRQHGILTPYVRQRREANSSADTG